MLKIFVLLRQKKLTQAYTNSNSNTVSYMKSPYIKLLQFLMECVFECLHFNCVALEIIYTKFNQIILNCHPGLLIILKFHYPLQYNNSALENIQIVSN